VNIRVTALINQMSTVSAANAKTTTMKSNTVAESYYAVGGCNLSIF
jgi:hypothetical protein